MADDRAGRSGAQRGITRRAVLRKTGAAAVGASGMVGMATAQPTPGFDDWFAETENYHGIVDETGVSTLTVAVGPGDVSGAPYAFGPAAVRVDPGTTVTWEWTGNGGMHNVVASDGSFESKLTKKEGFTFEHTFEETGVYRYYCAPHKALGMRGVVVVGDVEVGTGGGWTVTLPGTAFQQTFIGVVFGMLGLSIGAALAPEVSPVIRWTGRQVGSVGYAVHRRTGFRSQPVGATAVGWLTFGAILVAIGLAVLGLWTLGARPWGFLVALGVLGLLVAGYAASSAGVSLFPSLRGRPGTPSLPFPVRSRRKATPAGGRLDPGRTLPVLRGWLTIGSILAVGGVAAVALWKVAGGPLGLVVGLVAVALVVTGYAVSSTA